MDSEEKKSSESADAKEVASILVNHAESQKAIRILREAFVAAEASEKTSDSSV